MRLYLAGADKNFDCLLGLDNLAFLVSYFYLKKNKSFWDLVDMCNKNNIPLMLDCGAFSAKNQGVELDNAEYIDFCLEHQDKFSEIVSLDVIGNHQQTRQNYDEIIASGINAIPTFHFGSPFEYLSYFADKTNYIGLGGTVPRRSKTELFNWFRYIFHKYPKHKFHGFGVTTPKVLKEFNWHSIDGTTWITGALRYGRIMYYLGKGRFKWIHVQNQKQLEKNWHLIGNDIQAGWDLKNGRTEQYEEISLRYNTQSLIQLVDYCSNYKPAMTQGFLL